MLLLKASFNPSKTNCRSPAYLILKAETYVTPVIRPSDTTHAHNTEVAELQLILQWTDNMMLKTGHVTPVIPLRFKLSPHSSIILSRDLRDQILHETKVKHVTDSHVTGNWSWGLFGSIMALLLVTWRATAWRAC